MPVRGRKIQPGGNDTEVQFNDAGAFAGDTNLTYDKTNNILSVASSSTAYVAEGDNITGDFSSPVNVVYSSNNWENDTTVEYIIGTVTSSTSFGGSYVGSNAFDQDLGTRWISSTAGSDEWLQLTPSSTQVATRYRMYIDDIDAGIARQPVQWTFEGRIGAGAWQTLDTQGVAGLSAEGYTDWYDISSPGVYDDYRMYITETRTPGTFRQVTELEIEGYDDLPDGTIDAVLSISGSPDVVPSTLAVKTNAGAAVNDADVKISYNLDGAGFTALETLDLFKARSTFSSVSTLTVRLQPVDDKVFDYVSISTPGTEAAINSNGSIIIKENSVQVGAMTNAGYTFPDNTTQTTAAVSDADAIDVTQVAHTLSVQDAIYFDGTNWLKAKADAVTTLGVGVVSAVEDADNFTVVTNGKVTGLAGLTTGEWYYVSDATAGLLTLTESSIYSNPLLEAISATTGIVLSLRAHDRGEVRYLRQVVNGGLSDETYDAYQHISGGYANSRYVETDIIDCCDSV